MGDGLQHFGGIVSGIVVGIITLAIVAVVLSQRADTAAVVGSSGSALANVIAAAVSPVTGQSVTPNVGSSSTFLPGTLTSLSSFGSAL